MATDSNGDYIPGSRLSTGVVSQYAYKNSTSFLVHINNNAYRDGWERVFGKRTCTQCKKEKMNSEFYRTKEDWFVSACKECTKKNASEYASKNKEKVAIAKKEYNRKNADVIRIKKAAYAAENKDILAKKGSARSIENREELSKYQKDWREENKDKLVEYSKIYLAKEENKKKHAARGKVNKALASGKLIKPNICSVCGENGTTEAHHEDYSKPLDVRWLCSACHKKLHRKWRK